MGRVCICGSSAIEFWRLWRLFGHAVFRAWGLRPLPEFARNWRSCIVSEVPPLFTPASQEDLEALTSPDDMFLSTPVDLFVSADEKLGHSSSRATRPIPADLPPRLPGTDLRESLRGLAALRPGRERRRI